MKRTYFGARVSLAHLLLLTAAFSTVRADIPKSSQVYQKLITELRKPAKTQKAIDALYAELLITPGRSNAIVSQAERAIRQAGLQVRSPQQLLAQQVQALNRQISTTQTATAQEKAALEQQLQALTQQVAQGSVLQQQLEALRQQLAQKPDQQPAAEEQQPVEDVVVPEQQEQPVVEEQKPPVVEDVVVEEQVVPEQQEQPAAEEQAAPEQQEPAGVEDVVEEQVLSEQGPKFTETIATLSYLYGAHKNILDAKDQKLEDDLALLAQDAQRGTITEQQVRDFGQRINNILLTDVFNNNQDLLNLYVENINFYPDTWFKNFFQLLLKNPSITLVDADSFLRTIRNIKNRVESGDTALINANLVSLATYRFMYNELIDFIQKHKKALETIGITYTNQKNGLKGVMVVEDATKAIAKSLDFSTVFNAFEEALQKAFTADNRQAYLKNIAEQKLDLKAIVGQKDNVFADVNIISLFAPFVVDQLRAEILARFAGYTPESAADLFGGGFDIENVAPLYFELKNYLELFNLHQAIESALTNKTLSEADAKKLLAELEDLGKKATTDRVIQVLGNSFTIPKDVVISAGGLFFGKGSYKPAYQAFEDLKKQLKSYKVAPALASTESIQEFSVDVMNLSRRKDELKLDQNKQELASKLEAITKAIESQGLTQEALEAQKASFEAARVFFDNAPKAEQQPVEQPTQQQGAKQDILATNTPKQNLDALVSQGDAAAQKAYLEKLDAKALNLENALQELLDLYSKQALVEQSVFDAILIKASA